MINIEDKKNCCGCGACVNICLKKCIELIEDKEGFLYPVIDKIKCVNCKLCEDVCPISNKKSLSNEIIEAYASYVKDDCIREKSSSGGVFSLIANEILNDNGVVFGAVFDKDFSVKHVAIDNVGDLNLLRGSKYLQSRIENTYQKAKEYLENGTTVLYSGVACQIEGLKAFLGKEYENLYTVDVLCHGVPSPKLWQKYIDYQEKMYNSKVEKIIFRHKKYGWKSYQIFLGFSNKISYEKKYYEDIFMKLFLKDICLRPSCHSCRFKELDRASDITLGDCWGINKIMPEMDDDKGTSIVLIHSRNGKLLLEDIQKNLVLKMGDVDELLPKNADSRKSVKKHKNRDKFFNKLNKENVKIVSLVKLIEPSLCLKVKNY